LFHSRTAAGAVIAGSLGLLAAAPDAGASGFALRENSAEGLGMAFAGAGSAATDLSTIFNNPAGMTRFNGNGAEAGGSYIFPSARFTGTAATNTGAAVAGDGTANGGTQAFVPAAYGLWSLSPDLKLGIAVTAPFGLLTRYSSGWVGRYNAINTELHTVDVNPAVAYRVNDWLSLGGGVSAQYEHTRLTQAVRLAPFPDAGADLTGSDWGYGFNLGTLIEPMKDTRFGLAYRSQVYHKVEGNIAFSLPGGLPGAIAAGFPNSGAKAQLHLPDSVTLSATHDYSPKFSVSADLQWTHWSLFNNLTAVRSTTGSVVSFTQESWTNTWFGALGATYKFTNRLSLRGGVAYDQSPVKDQFRTARIPDQDRYWLATGLGYEIAPGVGVDLGYTHIFVDSASINSAFPVPLAGTATGTLTGSYQNHIDIVSLAAKLRF
jgi:long-chain fatty acid transport protein